MGEQACRCREHQIHSVLEADFGGMSDHHTDKRPRVEEGSSSDDLAPIRPGLLTVESHTQLHDAYESSGPYKHGVLHPLCEEASLRGCFEEMQAHLTGTFKETDLFKVSSALLRVHVCVCRAASPGRETGRNQPAALTVDLTYSPAPITDQVYQTGDLGAMDANDARLPQLLRLRKALYSPQFREFISSVTGCGQLSDRVDCSCNLYLRGGHLLCHDDVIGTRKVSYIVYLAEPDEGWASTDGGALELYPLAQPGVPGEPAVYPSQLLLPQWNSMAIFTVVPGVSFHSVQEVFNDSKLRLSISGWYHAADAPHGMALASLNQLQTQGLDDVGAGPFMPMPLPLPPGVAPGPDHGDLMLSSAQLEPPEMSSEEQALLDAWISPEYLTPEGQAGVARLFINNSSVALRSFLLPHRFAAIATAAAEADAADGLGHGAPPPAYTTGTVDGWTPVGPPHKQRFLAYRPQSQSTGRAAASPHARVGRALEAVRGELLNSSAFAKLLWRLTALRVTHSRALARRFRPGLDYTVAHFGVLTGDESRLDASLCCVAETAEDDANGWQSGEVGGFECYLQAEQSADGQPLPAADVYKARDQQAGGEDEDEEDDLLSVHASANTLSLVHRCVGSYARNRPHLSTLPFRCCNRANLCPAVVSLCGQQKHSQRGTYAGCVPTCGAVGTQFRAQFISIDAHPHAINAGTRASSGLCATFPPVRLAVGGMLALSTLF